MNASVGKLPVADEIAGSGHCQPIQTQHIDSLSQLIINRTETNKRYKYANVRPENACGPRKPWPRLTFFLYFF